MENEQSLIVGSVVEYSVQRNNHSFGFVLDKVLAKEKPEDDFAVTKYLIHDQSTGKVVCVSAWRIVTALNQDEVPKGNLEGGYDRDNGM